MIVYCANCCEPTEKTQGEVNRAAKIGARLFCNRTCAGMQRRTGKTAAQKVADKRLYDMAYRAKNLERIKAKKKAYHQRTYDPVKAAQQRKKTMLQHVEYCRKPKYKAWKRQYDEKRRDSMYGPFSTVKRLVINLNREIKQRMSNYEIRSENQTLNKRQARTRAASETPSRKAHSGA